VHEGSHRTSLKEHALLFRRFLRNPRTVGAVTPSSRALAEGMVADIVFRDGDHIVELGPGTGVFTNAIVEHLKPGARFLTIDIDPAFVERIRQRWPSFACVCASAERLDELVAEQGMQPVDHILSGLPFVSLPAVVTRQILENVSAVLRPGGTFTTFQYVHAAGWPSARQFRVGMSGKMGGAPEIKLVVKNFPPALVLTWTKTPSGDAKASG